MLCMGECVRNFHLKCTAIVESQLYNAPAGAAVREVGN